MQQNQITRVALPALALLIVSAFVGYARADPPVQTVRPPECAKPFEDQYFCCDWVDPSGNGGKGTGGGCVKVTEDHVNSCDKWLACGDGATGDGGNVTCTAGEK